MKKTMTLACAFVMLFLLSGCNIIKLFTSSPEERVEQWVARQQSDIQQLNKQYEGTMDFSLDGEGHDVLLTIRYLFITDQDGDAADLLDGSADAFGVGNYVDMYKNLRDTVVDREVKLTVRLCDSQGKVLSERVVDDAFVNSYTGPGGGNHAGESLEAYVMGGVFQSSIAANNTEDITVSALVEKGTVVLLYTLTEEVDREYLEDTRAAWDQSFAGEEMNRSLSSMYRMLKQSYPDEMKGLKVRITDPTGDTLYECSYEE